MQRRLLVPLALFFAAGCGKSDDNDGCPSAKPHTFALASGTETWTTGENTALTSPGTGELGGGGASDDCARYASDKAGASSGMLPRSAESGDVATSEDAAGSDGGDADVGGIGGEGGDGNTQLDWRILTAGTFDDALNSDPFAQYWASPVVSQSSEDASQLQWPKFEDLPTGERFSGTAKTALDLSFVVDVTGSMGDELAYINTELGHIVAAIKDKYPAVIQRWSLIVYRDEGDEYITRGINFTGDLTEFQQYLSQQQAGGGGDMPEAMHTALQEAEQRLQWGDESTAKVMFLIADAPSHVQHVPATLAAIQKLDQKGVHIYPVASSGVEALAERLMRYGAILSGGEYIFLTDDSGVGSPHAEPHVPCYVVRKLADVMIDTLAAEIRGARVTPDAATVLRTVGNPVEGQCQ